MDKYIGKPAGGNASQWCGEQRCEAFPSDGSSKKMAAVNSKTSGATPLSGHLRGLGCFGNVPEIVTDEDYKTKQLTYLTSEIRIFVYNIDKFNKETASMRRDNEMIGNSFIQMLSELNDLAFIMDESHHYRAEKGAAALNDLKPLWVWN